MSEQREPIAVSPQTPPPQVVEYANPELHRRPPSTVGQRIVGSLGVLVYGVLAAPFVFGVIANAWMGGRPRAVVTCSAIATLFLWRAVAAARQASR